MNRKQQNRTAAGFSRRDFLKLSAAVAAFPYIIPGSALGKDGRPAPSERIVMGGIGIGNMGSGDQGNFLSHDQVQYVAVCDVRREYRQNAQNRANEHYGNKSCAAYNDFRELLARPDIDAVHIATPDHWHGVLGVAACTAGKDVYCQKPESLTIKEGRAMVDAARRFGRVFSGGSQRVMEDYMDTVRRCWGGAAGTPKEIYVDCGGPSIPCNLPGQPVPDGIDWDMWLGPAPAVPYHPYRIDGNFNIDSHTCWRSWRDYSGGGMTDWGAHHFGGMLFAANKMEEGPVEVLPPDGKDRKYLTYRFADGVLLYHSRDRHHDVVCGGPAVAPRPIPKYKGTGGIYGDFLHCVRTREKPFRDIERAHRTASICHLGSICYQLNRPLKWDALNEVFVGDDNANRLLDRARRGPWTI